MRNRQKAVCYALLMLHPIQNSFAQDKALCKEQLQTIKMRTFLSFGCLGFGDLGASDFELNCYFFILVASWHEFQALAGGFL